jgi:hypothetical protein
LAKYLRITRLPYEEPHHLDLMIEVSNGRSAGQLEIYTTPEALTDCGEALEVFPRHGSDVFLWEIGSERSEDQWAYYFRMRSFVTESVGACALQFRLNNNATLPETEVTEFCIEAEPSQLNRLGKLFRDFARLEHKELFWNVAEGMLS